MNGQHDPIVVTGTGLISPFGTDLKGLRSWLDTAHDGRVSLDGYRDDYFTLEQVMGIPIREWNAADLLGKRGLQFMQPGTKYLMGAALLALRDAGLEESMPQPEELGVVVGTNYAGILTTAVYDHTTLTEGPKYVSPMEAPNTLANSPASHLAIRIRSQACNTTVSTGMSAGLDALGYAMNVLEQNRASCVVAGGVEELNSRVLWIYENGGLLPSRNQNEVGRPFDDSSNGLLPSEGSAVAVLERKSSAVARGARIYAELLSWSSSFSAAAEPQRRAKAMERVLNRTLAVAGYRPDEIGLIVSGANGLHGHDEAEALALKQVFGEADVPVSAVKGILGESCGAGGMYQLLAAICSSVYGKAQRSGGSPMKAPVEVPMLLTSQDLHGAVSALLIKTLTPSSLGG